MQTSEMKTAPIPIPGQKIAVSWLAPTVHVILWIVTLAALASLLALGILALDKKAEERQHKSEQKAVAEQHAVEVKL